MLVIIVASVLVHWLCLFQGMEAVKTLLAEKTKFWVVRDEYQF